MNRSLFFSALTLLSFALSSVVAHASYPGGSNRFVVDASMAEACTVKEIQVVGGQVRLLPGEEVLSIEFLRAERFYDTSILVYEAKPSGEILEFWNEETPMLRNWRLRGCVYNVSAN